MFGGSLLMYTLLAVENKKRRNGKWDHWVEGKTSVQINALGDRRPDFFYAL